MEPHPAVETARAEAIFGDLNSDNAAWEKTTQARALEKKTWSSEQHTSGVGVIADLIFLCILD